MSVGLLKSDDIAYNGTNNVARMDLFVDSAADLVGLISYDSIILLQGSSAKDISTGDEYIMQSNGTWVKQPSKSPWSDVYTKTEIDNMLSDKQDTLTTAQLAAANSGITAEFFEQLMKQPVNILYDNMVQGYYRTNDGVTFVANSTRLTCHEYTYVPPNKTSVKIVVDGVLPVGVYYDAYILFYDENGYISTSAWGATTPKTIPSGTTKMRYVLGLTNGANITQSQLSYCMIVFS